MLNFIIRRVLYMVPILFGVALVTFTLFNLVGADPVLVMVGRHANPEVIATLRAELGLDQPLWRQFLDFLWSVVSFDYGRSYSTKQDIIQMMLATAPVSLALAVPGFLITLVLSISLALFVAFWRGSWADRLLVVGSVILISVPSLAYILFGQYFLAYKMGIFPISGFSWGFPEVVSYLGLPVIIWVILSLGFDLRFYRTVMLDEISQDYIRTARSKGLAERVVMFKHVLKNAMIPIITSVVLSIPSLITGALLLESFFGIPGMGSLSVDAVNTSDLPVIKAQVMILSMFYMVFNLISDLCYAWADPRITLK